MVHTRIHVGLTAAQVRLLDRLAVKLGLDRTNTLRYCLAKIADQEKVK